MRYEPVDPPRELPGESPEDGHDDGNQGRADDEVVDEDSHAKANVINLARVSSMTMKPANTLTLMTAAATTTRAPDRRAQPGAPQGWDHVRYPR